LPDTSILRDASSKVKNGFIQGVIGFGTLGRKVGNDKTQSQPLPENNVKRDK
jgi:hypothetical protein